MILRDIRAPNRIARNRRPANLYHMISHCTILYYCSVHGGASDAFRLTPASAPMPAQHRRPSKGAISGHHRKGALSWPIARNRRRAGVGVWGGGGVRTGDEGGRGVYEAGPLQPVGQVRRPDPQHPPHRPPPTPRVPFLCFIGFF